MHCSTKPLDTNYAAPRVLSTLDELMNEILNRCDMSDSDKWKLYNQALQRYLIFVKHTNSRNQSKQSETPTEQNRTISENNHRFDSFSLQHPISDISGVDAMRDSLDSIQQPNVRDFFERMRENDSNQRLSSSLSELNDNDDLDMRPHSRPVKKARAPRVKRNKPYGQHQTRSRTAPKRATDTILSGMKACKVLLRPDDILNWNTSSLR